MRTELAEDSKCRILTLAFIMHLPYASLGAEKAGSSQHCGDRSVGVLGTTPLTSSVEESQRTCVRSGLLKHENHREGRANHTLQGPCPALSLQDFLTR